MQSNGKTDGVIKIGRKGLRKFAFGDGPAFEVDVVVAFQKWMDTDDQFRPIEPDADGRRPVMDVSAWHKAAVGMVLDLAGDGYKEIQITVAEALDFIARLREEYDAVADFFVPRSAKKPESPDTSAPALSFSEEGTES